MDHGTAAIRRAFFDYQNAAETRRTLAFEIGDVNARLLGTMTAAGFSADEARAADAGALADGRYRSADAPGE
jgi:hypothetical protein